MRVTGLIALLLLSPAASAAPSYFSDRTLFQSVLAASLTDTYEPELGYGSLTVNQYTDGEMSAVFGETEYMATGFPGGNFVVRFTANNYYCAGCNGSFTLDFDGTSLSSDGGLFGVGMDVVFNIGNAYDALLTFADGSEALRDLDGSFFGVTSLVPIVAIAFGPNGEVSTSGAFAIDNLTIGAQGEQARLYAGRSAFEAAVGDSKTDTYEPELGYGGNSVNQYPDAAMSAIFGETRYTATGFADANIVLRNRGNSGYCAGCNGSFMLDFGSTSLSRNGAVFGVALDILSNPDAFYDAQVTFGDGSTRLFGLEDVNLGGPGFFGLTSSVGIASIAFGQDGQPSTTGSFLIDNLAIGGFNAIPEPANWALMISGFGLLGAAFRRRRQTLGEGMAGAAVRG